MTNSFRYIPVPTGNSKFDGVNEEEIAVYPCTYRELLLGDLSKMFGSGISLYLQGTRPNSVIRIQNHRYIPVPTGNSHRPSYQTRWLAVYPCTYRELCCIITTSTKRDGISLYLQGTLALQQQLNELLRYIPVPTGNSLNIDICFI